MTANVRIFSYAGIVAARVQSGGGASFQTDSLFTLKQPYLARETLTATASAAVESSTETSPKGTDLLRVEVQEGKIIHYEINPPNRSVVADTSSPTLSGATNFNFGIGWTISVFEMEVT